VILFGMGIIKLNQTERVSAAALMNLCLE